MMTPIFSSQHREERKNLILDVAKEVFVNKGFNATTIQDIINHSGVSRGGVYTIDLVTVFIDSLFFGYLFYKTNNLYIPWLAHALAI